jgi:hypothetical protein
VGKVSPFRSLCCVGSTPTRAASLDDREPRRTPSWSGPRADSGEKHGPGRSCGGYRLYWRSLCAQRVGQSVSIPVRAFGLARAASLDDRPQHARRSMEFCARLTDSAGTTVTRRGGDAGFRPRRLRRGQLCRAIGRGPTEREGAAKITNLRPLYPKFLSDLLHSSTTGKECHKRS